MKFFFMQTTTVKTFRHVFLKLVDNVIHNHISKFPLTNLETFFSYFGRFLYFCCPRIQVRWQVRNRFSSFTHQQFIVLYKNGNSKSEE